jgi:uncharacterized repeat protein (TIGR01451 family)
LQTSHNGRSEVKMINNFHNLLAPIQDRILSGIRQPRIITGPSVTPAGRIGLLCLILYLGILPNLAHAQMISSQIAASSDDAEQAGAPGTAIIDIGPHELGKERYSGYRFTGLAIPVGATIISASIQFTAESANINGTPRARIVGQKSGQSGPFKEKNNNITNRAATVASVDWQIPPWLINGESGPAQQTPDLAVIIQEIVDRPQWASGNPLILIFEPNGGDEIRTVHTWDSSAVDAAVLTVEFSIGANLTIIKSSETVNDPLGSVSPAALAIPGATIEYEISVTNTGTSDANEVIVTDTLDANLSFLAGEYNGGAADIEIIVGASPAVYFVAEVGGVTK